MYDQVAYRKSQTMKRRNFFRSALGAASLPAALRASSEKRTGGRLKIGFIGVGSRGTGLLRLVLSFEGVEIPALCDIDRRHLERGRDIVEKARGKRPDPYGKDAFDYRRFLAREDLDAVLIATPVELHAAMAIDSMEAGKAVACEVVAATTIEECWKLVRTHERTGVPYMTLENYVFRRPIMCIQNMVEKGVFGELTSAECGYIHALPFGLLFSEGKLTWRGLARLEPSGNHYPTHSLGPVCGWLGINKGDRLTRLVSMSCKPAARAAEARRLFPEGHPLRKVKWVTGDNNMTLIQTAQGRMITVRYDTDSPRPHNMTHYALQGTGASYHSTGERIYIVGRSPENTWEPLSKYFKEYDHPAWAWKTKAAEAEKRKNPGVDAVTSATLRAWGTGHGGGDFLEIWYWLKSLREKTPPPLGIYDAVTWACIEPLSVESVARGSVPLEIPDFTRGRWKSATRRGSL